MAPTGVSGRGSLAARQAARRARARLSPITRRVGETVAPSPRLLTRPSPASGLRGVPGDPGLPLIGYSLRYVSDALGWAQRRYEVYGPVFWSDVVGQRMVTGLGPDATEQVLVNRDKAFSQAGWEHFIGPFFERGLMLLDFEEHLRHRRIMQRAFTRDRLAGYLEAMQPPLRSAIGAWPSGRVRLFDLLKALLLDSALHVFVGVELAAEERARLQRAFLDTVQAGTAIVRADVPGSRWRAGLRGRRLLEDFFRAHLPAKRAGDDEDLFAALARAEDEDGGRFSDADVVNHMIFALMAAHDTSTITLTSMCCELARAPGWQRRLRDEVDALGDRPLAHGDLDALVDTDLVMREALRLLTPVPTMPRLAVADTELLGREVPAGTSVNVVPWFTHRSAEWWPDPLRFDPERFAEHRREDKVHPYAWAPFGGGAHKCIGMHFASVQVTAVMVELLRHWRWSVPEGYEMPLDTTALPLPADGLPVRLEPR